MKRAYYADEAGKWFDTLANVLRAVGVSFDRNAVTHISVHRPVEIHGRWQSFAAYNVRPVQSKKYSCDTKPQRVGIEVGIVGAGRTKTIWATRNDDGWDYVTLVSRVVGYVFEDMAVDLAEWHFRKREGVGVRRK